MMKYKSETLKRKIKTLVCYRKKYFVSVKEIAEDTGISQATLYRFEKGECDSMYVFDRYANFIAKILRKEYLEHYAKKK